MTKYEIVATFSVAGPNKSASTYSVRPVTVLFEGVAYAGDTARPVLIGVCNGEQFRGDPADFYSTEAEAMEAANIAH